MATSKRSTPSGAKGKGAVKRSTSAKSTGSAPKGKPPTGKGSKAPLSPELVTNIFHNALGMLEAEFGTVKLRFASYDPGRPEFFVVMPKGVTFCAACGVIFPGEARYCDAHQPVTVHAPDPVPNLSVPA